MTCGGCKNAVTRILGKIDGISSFDADVEKKEVTVTGTFDEKLLLEKLEKWGKAAKKTVSYIGEA